MPELGAGLDARGGGPDREDQQDHDSRDDMGGVKAGQQEIECEEAVRLDPDALTEGIHIFHGLQRQKDQTKTGCGQHHAARTGLATLPDRSQSEGGQIPRSDQNHGIDPRRRAVKLILRTGEQRRVGQAQRQKDQQAGAEDRQFADDQHPHDQLSRQLPDHWGLPAHDPTSWR